MIKRSMQQVLLALVAVFLLTHCSAKIVSTKLAEAPPDSELKGVVYTLPRTVLKVTLPVTLTVTGKAPYGEFRRLFLPATDALKEGRGLALKQATFSTFGEADPNHIYVAQVRNKRALDQSMTFLFTEDGAVTGMKATVTDTTSDVIVSAIGTAVSLYPGFAGGGQGQKGFGGEPDPRCKYDPYDEKSFRQCFLMNREDLLANFDALKDDKTVLLEMYKKPEGRAQLFAARAVFLEIEALAGARLEALQEPDTALGDFLDRNQKAGADRVAQFIGSRLETTWEGVFEIRPDNCNEDACQPCWTSEPLLEYVPSGICTMNQVAGTPLPQSMRANPEKDCDGTRKKITITLDQPARQLFTQLASAGKPKEAALFFNVPAEVRVKLKNDDKKNPLLGQGDLLFAQLGFVAAMPSKLGGKSVTHDLLLYSNTGALQSYSLSSTAMLSKDLIESLGGSAKTLLDARNKQAEAEKLEGDKLTQLERDLKILDATAKLKALCQTLGIPDDKCPV